MLILRTRSSELYKTRRVHVTNAGKSRDACSLAHACRRSTHQVAEVSFFFEIQTHKYRAIMTPTTCNEDKTKSLINLNGKFCSFDRAITD